MESVIISSSTPSPFPLLVQDSRPLSSCPSESSQENFELGHDRSDAVIEVVVEFEVNEEGKDLVPSSAPLVQEKQEFKERSQAGVV